MKIQAQYFLPVTLKKYQRWEEMFAFYGTISLPALPAVGTIVCEFEAGESDTAEVTLVRLVPEDGKPQRLIYEIRIESDVQDVTEWNYYVRWSKKVEWILGLGLSIVAWPGQGYSDLKTINSIEQFTEVCNQAWYEKVVSEIPVES